MLNTTQPAVPATRDELSALARREVERRGARGAGRKYDMHYQVLLSIAAGVARDGSYALFRERVAALEAA
jgi:hypothetical protein